MNRDRGRRRGAGSLAGWAAGALAAVLPFEPRAAFVEVAGLRVSPLEAAAAVAAALLAWQGRQRLRELLRRPPLPLVLAALFAAANVLAALLAPAFRAESGRFALRLCALAVFAWLFAAAGPRARRAGLLGLAAGGALVAALCTLEALGLTRLDPLLDAFRDAPFNVGGARRATGGTAYPTVAAAWIAAALMVAAAVAGARARAAHVAAAAAVLLAPGLLFTYSRGALAAALAGLCVAAVLALRSGDRSAAGAAATALAVTVAAAAVFTLRADVFRLRLATDGTTAWYGARYAPAETELRLRPGEERATAVRVANTGLKAWSSADGFALSYHWFDPVRRRVSDGGRTPLPRTLAHGEEALLHPVLYAPPEPGCYLLVWDVVQEHTTWLSGQGVATTAVPALVGAADARDCAHALPPSARVGGQPGRRHLWPAALAMWAERPWTGMGPDTFRRLYGRYAGRAFWDDRVSANSLLLETAAGSGLLGVLALSGMLVSAFVGAVGHAAATDPGERAAGRAVAALLAVFAVHGAVDYLLGFTGPYLMVAFLVGSCASAPARAAARPHVVPERGAA